jgi:pimeloyl-ACP methyl ester carboxylesterase
MKRAKLLLPSLLITIFLISCSNAPPNVDEPMKFITPGDQIGDMTLEQSTTIPYQSIWKFCTIFDENEPFEYSTNCVIPAVSGLDVPIGWFAKESKIQENWDSMSWMISIDGEIIDLEAFDWIETEYPQHGENNIERFWILTITNLTPGEHTFIKSWTSSEPVDDGFNTYQPGTYQQTTIFKVQERQDYPILTDEPNSGQHAYTSMDDQIDYLLYLPEEYAKNSQVNWPLIVYLHGAIWRGSTPEMLIEESLPNKLEREADLPFIVLSPVGEGEFDFWATDEMIDPIFALLDELQAKLNIDSSRIYLTGNDTGGNGVWEIALQYPQYFAALAPVTGYFDYPFRVPGKICDLKDVPVWAFHGRRDEVIPMDAGQELIDALNACGGDAKLTVSKDMNIDVRFNVYQNDDLYNWLLEQSLD